MFATSTLFYVLISQSSLVGDDVQLVSKID